MVTLQNVYELADSLGIRIVYEDLPGDLTGWIVCHPGRRPGVALDFSLLNDPIRHKCTLAHEIGHAVTAEGDGVPRISTPFRYRCLASRVEHQGRAWAAAYLIPHRELKKAMLSGYCETWELQEHFEVMPEIMRFRLNMSDGIKLKNSIARKMSGKVLVYG